MSAEHSGFVGAGPVGADEPDTISVRGLTKCYGPVTVLRGIDLRVTRGEVFTLLGPNGAGKTTTVEILTGARRRSGGQVMVLGGDPAADSRAWRARIGVVPQSPGVFADLTVTEVVDHFAAFYPAPLPTAQVLDMVGLTGQRRQLCQRLSGGQQRRIDIAVGIVGDPDLMFLDEPTTGLDPQARRAVWDLVRRFAAQAKTTVLTTHYLDEAEALADRAAVIADGRVLTAGTLAELGGPQVGRATVSFVRSGALAGASLPALPADAVLDGAVPAGAVRAGAVRGGAVRGGAVRGGPGDETAVADRRVRLHTTRPTEAAAALIAWARAAGVRELPDLRIERPTLEEVYLALVDPAASSAASPVASSAASPVASSAASPVASSAH